MITSIELSNWKTHKLTKLDFSKGANIIIGQMGAGKSSVMDAISFALFGTFPSIQHRKTNVSYLIKSKPEQEDRASIRLSLSIDGSSYVVERGISQNAASTATLTKDGGYLQSQPQRVTEEIIKILKMDYDLFSRAVYSQQNGLDYFLNLRSSDRKKEIDNLLGLDKFSASKDNVTTLINKIKDIIKEDQKNMEEFDMEKLSAQATALEEEIKKQKELNIQKGKKLSEVKTGLASLEKELEKGKAGMAAKLKLQREATELKSKAEAYASEIEKIDKKGISSLASITAKLEKTKQELEKASEGYKAAAAAEGESSALLADAKAKLISAKKEAETKSRAKQALEKYDTEKTSKANSEAESNVEQARAALAKYYVERQDNEESLKELKKHTANCPICERELSPDLHKRLTEEKGARALQLTILIKEAEESLEKNKKEFESTSKEMQQASQLLEKLNEYAGLDETLKKLSKAFDEASAKNALERKGLEHKNNLVSEITEKVSKEASEKTEAETRERHSGEIQNINSLAREKEEKAKAITATEEAIEGMHKESIKLNSELSRTESELQSNRRYVEDKEAQRKEKAEQLERVKKISDDISKKRKTADNLAKFNAALGETQAQLRNYLIDSINSIMREIWPDLYPYKDYNDIMLEASEDDYVLKVNTFIRNKLSWEEVEAIASGGERSTACLAMRIAFSLVLAPNIKWLILDEPTHNLDQQAVLKLVNVFSDTLPKIIDQVFIITHDDLMKDVREGKVYMLSRDKEQNRETEVSGL